MTKIKAVGIKYPGQSNFWIQVGIKYPCYSLVRTDKSLIHYGITPLFFSCTGSD